MTCDDRRGVFHRATERYDRVATPYDATRRVSAETRTVLLRWLGRVEADAAVLSLGCGTGHHEAALAEGGAAVVGLDLSYAMLRVAVAHGRPLVQATMTEIPFREGSFGGVLMVQSLHHVGGTEDVDRATRDGLRLRVLRECGGVLDENGQLGILQSSPEQNAAVWFWEYFPEAIRRKLVIQPKIAWLVEALGSVGFDAVTATTYSAEIISGFFDPQAPLDPRFRASYSEFGYLSEDAEARGVRELRRAVGDGSAAEAIERSRRRFAELGGNLTLVSGAWHEPVV